MTGRCLRSPVATLCWRAIGADQSVQPDSHNPNVGSYVIDHPLPIEIFVAATR